MKPLLTWLALFLACVVCFFYARPVYGQIDPTDTDNVCTNCSDLTSNPPVAFSTPQTWYICCSNPVVYSGEVTIFYKKCHWTNNWCRFAEVQSYPFNEVTCQLTNGEQYFTAANSIGFDSPTNLLVKTTP